MQESSAVGKRTTSEEVDKTKDTTVPSGEVEDTNNHKADTTDKDTKVATVNTFGKVDVVGKAADKAEVFGSFE